MRWRASRTSNAPSGRPKRSECAAPVATRRPSRAAWTLDELVLPAVPAGVPSELLARRPTSVKPSSCSLPPTRASVSPNRFIFRPSPWTGSLRHGKHRSVESVHGGFPGLDFGVPVSVPLSPPAASAARWRPLRLLRNRPSSATSRPFKTQFGKWTTPCSTALNPRSGLRRWPAAQGAPKLCPAGAISI